MHLIRFLINESYPQSNTGCFYSNKTFYYICTHNLDNNRLKNVLKHLKSNVQQTLISTNCKQITIENQR